MHAEEKSLIDGLFSRLRAAESQAAPREAEAEALINEHLSRQPAAPYYMAQAIVVQENAIQQLDDRVKELEAQIETLKRSQSSAPQQSSGGFLSGLFGGGRSQPQAQQPASAPVAAQPAKSGWHEPVAGNRNSFGQQSGFGQQAGFGQRGGQPQQGGGFLSGALQTAAGVAGGMVLGNMLMDMFQGDEAEKVAEQAPAEPAEQPAAMEEPVAPEENYADSGFFGGGDEGGFFGGDDEDFV
ncbi:hypothetical protein SAMN05216201_12319 [Pseudomonas linyingensis]|uniref:DUF2076 domain-containing protein n=1 Tax=Pseudomonas linyingensis TaxID=915471 RepID=A0A1H7CHE3_9PSED|nr:DUF2076 domain-containing protein [Pseudomonas linyingensis]SEJ86552.1 hypothetical protein SAMN05216201_12319 [Pseudomonas linyingensis]